MRFAQKILGEAVRAGGSMYDTGVGISEEDVLYIFDHFYRSDKARPTSTGGAGLGLTIAKRIIDAHGGSIRVDARLGEDSLFEVRLPHTQDDKRSRKGRTLDFSLLTTENFLGKLPGKENVEAEE